MEDNMETFTYVITNAGVTTDSVYAQWNMRLNGLPSNQKFYCKVIDFVINSASLAPGISSYVTLGCRGFEDNIVNGYGWSPMCNVSTDSTVCQLFSGEGSRFICPNFNSKIIEFFLVDPDLMKTDAADVDSGTTTYWSITLLITPIN